MAEDLKRIERAARAFLQEERFRPVGGDDNEDEPVEDIEPDEEPQSPEEDDITTVDHHTFYQYGKLWLETPEDWEWEETAKAIQAQMEKDRFFPNCWWISDHGNAHLITDWPVPPRPEDDNQAEDRAMGDVDESLGAPAGEYAGFDAEYLNSGQPLPKQHRSVYHTEHQPWAFRYARLMRDKYGINAWVDGTVTRGWDILVHKSDKDRAARMFASVVGDRVTPGQGKLGFSISH
jgi:hypothetical protein